MKKLLANWPLKLLALVISFFMWATYTAEPLTEATFTAPVVFQRVPSGLDLSGEEITQVRVTLRGRTALLRRIQPSDLGLQMDLSGRGHGEFVFAFQPSHLALPLGVELVSVTPREVRVRLVPRNP